MKNHDQPILLGELLTRQGPAVLRTAIAGGSRDFMLAVRDCARCKSFDRCRAWLDSGATEGFEAFCPSAGYVQRITSLAR
jgi:hypothetical protein